MECEGCGYNGETMAHPRAGWDYRIHTEEARIEHLCRLCSHTPGHGDRKDDLARTVCYVGNALLEELRKSRAPLFGSPSGPACTCEAERGTMHYRSCAVWTMFEKRR